MKASEAKKRADPLTLFIIFCLAASDGIMGYFVLTGGGPTTAHAYFLDVGQGDSELMIFPGGVKVMVDAGPDTSALTEAANIFQPDDTYIDIAVISNPQADYFNGYNYILDHYHIGAVIYNGRDDTSGTNAWSWLIAKIQEEHIPLLTLGAGDRIHYGDNEIDILSPDKEFGQSPELNDTSLVQLLKTPTITALFTGAIGFNTENFLLAGHSLSHVDLLEVAQPASNYFSGSGFLKAINPRIAVIEVGAHNAPASVASSTKAQVFRTSEDGTVEIWMEGGILRVRKAKG